MPLSSAEAFASATVANIGVGFDILGLALQGVGDIIRAELNDGQGVTIAAIHGDQGKLPRAAAKNTAGIAAMSLMNALGRREGVALTIEKGLPLASGLGGSAASAVAAVVAVNALFDDPLSREELLPHALEGEAAISGYHADNVAPSLFGGITLSYGISAEQIKRIPVPENLYLAFVTPDVEVETAAARAVLPQQVSLKTMVAQTAAVARLMDALYREDIEAIGAAIEADGVIEPARAHLMPLLHEVRNAAKRVGAFGLVISGAGPTLLAICDAELTAEKVAKAMKAVYDQAGIHSMAQATQVETQGAHLIVPVPTL
jgi:homoserine kinase